MASGDKTTRLLRLSAAALVLQVVLQVVVGVVLSFQYVPTMEAAYESVQVMHRAVFLQGLHYWGSAILIVHSFLHVGGMVWNGLFRPPHSWGFAGAVGLFLSVLGFQITGNLLPMDKHGVQTAAIEGSIIARAPAGEFMSRIVMGGEGGFSEATLATWYAAHRIMLSATLVLSLALVMVWLKPGETRPNWKGALYILILPAAMAMLIPAPLGTPATAADFNKFDASPSWYTWPMHGLLVLSDRVIQQGWVGAILIPTAFVVFLFGLAAFGNRISEGAARGGLIAFLAVFAVGAIGFGGQFAALTGRRGPVAQEPAVTPENIQPIDRALADQGRRFFNELPCAGCHGRDGLKPGGGPSLASVGKEHPDIEFYLRYIKEPSSVKPGSTMPAFPNLEEEKLRAIAEFLRSRS